MIGKYKKRFAGILSGILISMALVVGTAPAALADNYNCGAYGAGAYQSNVCGATTDSGDLANTGQSLWLIILAVLLILAGTYMLYRTRKKMKLRTATPRKYDI